MSEPDIFDKMTTDEIVLYFSDKIYKLKKDREIMHPLGWEAGQMIDQAAVVKSLAIEMLAHRSDLQERAQKLPANLDRAKEALEQRAADLEKYAVAMYAVAAQMDPTGYQVGSMGGLIELAAKHGITLPAWMKPGAQ